MGRVDRRLMRRLTRRRSPGVDKLLVNLSKAAEHALLWLGLAAAGAAIGGRRGKRAAVSGVLALACTTSTVHAVKLLTDRRRPPRRRVLYRTPRTSSFPSGHAGSAFAFAVAATRETPEAGPLLLPLAAAVAYSRVYLGAHYPSDVVVGAAIGAAFGTGARSLRRRLAPDERESRQPETRTALPSSEAVLVVSPRAGRSRGLDAARRTVEKQGLHIVHELDVAQIDQLPALLRTAHDAPRVVIAAGGDGTIGAVVGQVAGCDNVLGILPLGTGNDVARALGIPLDPHQAAELLASGEISRVDAGRVTRPGQPPAYFAHAATAGWNVDFAKLATRPSVRARLGRLTYLAAALYTLRERPTFTCTLEHDGVVDEVTLLQLSVISARAVGGSLGLSVKGPFPDDHRLDVIAAEDVPPWKLLRAGLFLALGVRRTVPGIRAMHVERLGVGSTRALDLTLDGELAGQIPGRFDMLVGALRVITPPSS